MTQDGQDGLLLIPGNYRDRNKDWLQALAVSLCGNFKKVGRGAWLILSAVIRTNTLMWKKSHPRRGLQTWPEQSMSQRLSSRVHRKCLGGDVKWQLEEMQNVQITVQPPTHLPLPDCSPPMPSSEYQLGGLQINRWVFFHCGDDSFPFLFLLPGLCVERCLCGRHLGVDLTSVTQWTLWVMVDRHRGVARYTGADRYRKWRNVNRKWFWNKRWATHTEGGKARKFVCL